MQDGGGSASLDGWRNGGAAIINRMGNRRRFRQLALAEWWGSNNQPHGESEEVPPALTAGGMVGLRKEGN